MSRGRMISKEITIDKKVNSLSDDTSRLGFTWLITHADREGRTPGDPAVVRSMLFPRRSDISVEQMEGYIREWADTGLVLWYEANGDLWISLPNFDKHQVGLRKDREPQSNIPAPPGEDPQRAAGNPPPPPHGSAGGAPENYQKDDGKGPEDIPLKLIEGKGREGDDDESPVLSPLSIAFCNATKIQELTGGVEEWMQALEKLGKAGVEPCDIEQAVKEMDKKGYSIYSLRSIVNPAITAMNKRKRTQAILQNATHGWSHG